MCDSPLLVPLSHTHKHTHANKTIHQSFPIHSASKEADSSSRSTSFSQFRGVRRSVSLFMWVIYTAQFNLTNTPTIVANLWCIAEDLSLTFLFRDTISQLNTPGVFTYELTSQSLLAALQAEPEFAYYRISLHSGCCESAGQLARRRDRRQSAGR